MKQFNSTFKDGLRREPNRSEPLKLLFTVEIVTLGYLGTNMKSLNSYPLKQNTPFSKKKKKSRTPLC